MVEDDFLLLYGDAMYYTSSIAKKESRNYSSSSTFTVIFHHDVRSSEEFVLCRTNSTSLSLRRQVSHTSMR